MQKEDIRMRLLAAVASCGLVSSFVSPVPAAEVPVVAAEGQDNKLDEIVVTAERRSERLQDVPITVQSVNAATLASEGITTTRDLTAAFPGIVFAERGSFSQPVIRGVSSQGTGALVDPAIGLYVDGIYQSNPMANLYDLADIDRIEVLKGPQGTLYGRNATGGAINIVTLQPQHTATMDASVGYGSLNEKTASIYATGPLSETLAGSIAASGRNQDGYTRNILTGQTLGDVSSASVRAKLLWTPWQGAEFLLSGFGMYDDDASAYVGPAVNGNSLSRRLLPSGPIATQPYTASNGQFDQLYSHADGVNLTSRFDVAGGKLTSQTAWSQSYGHVREDADGGPANALYLDLALPDRAVSEEVTFGSRDYGPASFLVGALYYDEKGSSDLIVNMGRHTIGTQEGRALALYGEIYYKITDGLKLTAGARYNDELRIYDGGFSLAPTLPVSEARIGEKAFVGWTPRVALSFEPTHDLNFYVNYSEGFKSGAFNPTSLSPVAVKPEEVKSVELGAKASFSKGYVNVAAFHYDYTNMQVVSVVTSGGATASLLQNAAAATGEGIDLDGSFKVLEKFRLFGGVSLLDAKYKNFPNAVVSSPNPACGAAPYPCGNVNVVENLSGASLIRAPHFSGTLNAEYTQPLGKLGEIGATATAYNSSTFNWEPTGRVRQGNYSTLAATLEWRPQSRSYSVTVWGRNLTNRAYEVMETDSAGGDLVGYAQPRAFGVRFGFHF